MGKFTGSATRPTQANAKGAIITTDERIPTYEGGGGHSRTAESDLFLLAVTNMVGEDTFYEKATDRDKRYVELIHKVTKTNPAFILGNDARMGFARFLRSEMLMRSASVVLACEYVAAGGPFGRRVVDAVCQRPDEPAEVVGYWHSTYGRRLPMPIKRGVADATRRLYNERSALRYDGTNKAMRMGDVLELVHPKPAGPWQASLFRYLLDERHHNDGTKKLSSETLPLLNAAATLAAVPENERRAYLRANPGVIADAGWSWERLSGWLPGGMDAEAWQWATSNMGVMALVRNLRNFDKAGIDEATVDSVIAKITDPAEVAKARLFPYQVWAAYREAPSDNWKRALGKTLDLTTSNIPDGLDGTLVVIDCSGSMEGAVSGKSTLRRWEVAAVMAASTVKGTKNSNVVIFGHDNKDITPKPGTSALATVERVRTAVSRGEVGHATYGHTAVKAHFDPNKHKRVVIFTDDQMHDSADGGSWYGRGSAVSIDHVPLVYTFNLAGYRPSSLPSGQKGRYTLGGFSDATFRAIPLLESGRNADWPF